MSEKESKSPQNEEMTEKGNLEEIVADAVKQMEEGNDKAEESQNLINANRKSARPQGNGLTTLDLDDFALADDSKEKEESKETVEDNSAEVKSEEAENIQEENKPQEEKDNLEDGIQILSAEEILKAANDPKETQAEETVNTGVFGSEDEEEKVPKKKGKGKKIAGIIAAMLLVTAGGAYAGMSYYYTDKFFEGTTINGIDCSQLNAAEVEKLIADKVEDYSISVSARNLLPEEIKGNEIDYKYVSNGDISKLLQEQKCYEWILGYINPFTYTAGENIRFDQSALEAKLLELKCASDENQIPPENAHIEYSNGEFSIIPESEGSTLILAQAYKILETAVGNSETAVDFDAEGAYEAAYIKKDNPELQTSIEAYNKYCRASITYDFIEKEEVLDGNTIKDWLTTSSDGSLVRDPEVFRERVTEYVAALGRKYDTVGEPQVFTATDGREVTVYGMEYGWSIDEEAEIEQVISEIENGEIIEREPIYAMTANSHGQCDVGDTYIEVDLGLQHMYYYMDGVIVFESDIISGLPDGVHTTPEGIYLLYNKESPAVLIGTVTNGVPEYVSPVSYWMPFNGGIGFHDATWQTMGFGGSLYTTLGSHGCINMPLDAAAELYSIIRFGDPIVCFY